MVCISYFFIFVHIVINKFKMKRLITLSFFFYLVVFLVSCHDDEEPKIKASRTVLMYLVADNSISDDIYPNIASVEEGLKNAETPGTFVIYWDGGIIGVSFHSLLYLNMK